MSMGVYIKDFIKSEDEFNCKWYEKVYLRPFPYCHFLRDSCRGAEKCPLIEVPEPHGRLIDADKLKETLYYYIREAGWSDEINKALSWVKDEFIDSEPTVIPTSEECEP